MWIFDQLLGRGIEISRLRAAAMPGDLRVPGITPAMVTATARAAARPVTASPATTNAPREER